MARRSTPDIPSTDTQDEASGTTPSATPEGGAVAGHHPGFGIAIRWPLERVSGVAAGPGVMPAGQVADEPAGPGMTASPDDAAPQTRASAQDAKKKAEIAAVRLLARREHSSQELRRKLRGRGHDEQHLDAVLAKLEGNQLQSDERFTSSYVQHHARRGQGPVRIRAELRQQGIDEAQINQQFATAQLDWVQLAAEVRQRKFGADLPQTVSERAKQARFLQYRGFNSDQIRAALDFDPAEDVEP